jgi:Uma2 family endonuclease
MSSPTHTKRPGEGAEAIPPLVNGDHLDQPTFHQRYEAMPEGTRAELIGGIVYVHSPAKNPHGHSHSLVNRWLGAYEEATPGTQTNVEASTLMGPETEPQPDCCLFLLPEVGGQLTIKDEWLVGAPELIAEIAVTSESFDLNAKKLDYQKAGVKEYVVVALRQQRVYWFVNRDEAFVDLTPGPDGVYRSEVFPGLWLGSRRVVGPRHDARPGRPCRRPRHPRTRRLRHPAARSLRGVLEMTRA